MKQILLAYIPSSIDHCPSLSDAQCFENSFAWFRPKINLVPVTPSLLEVDAKNINFYNMDKRLFRNKYNKCLPENPCAIKLRKENSSLSPGSETL